MRHILKIFIILTAVSAFWVGLLETLVPLHYACCQYISLYHLDAMVYYGLMYFPPREAALLQQDITEAMKFFEQKGVDVASI